MKKRISEKIPGKGSWWQPWKISERENKRTNATYLLKEGGGGRKKRLQERGCGKNLSSTGGGEQVEVARISE